MNQELQRIEPPIDSEPESFALIRYAMEKGVDASVMEKMMSIRRELQAEKAKKDFGDSMAAFQSECPPVIKTKSVEGAYKYSPFDEIVQVVKVCEAKHGFQHKLDTVDSETGWITGICTVSHRSGHSEVSRVKLPIGTGTRMMSTTQIYAAAQSFALRRAFCNAFGIVPQGDDMEGRLKQHQQTKGPNPVAPDANDAQVRAAAKTLWNMLKPVRGSEMNWIEANKFMVQNKILTAEQEAPNLPLAELQESISKATIVLRERMGS